MEYVKLEEICTIVSGGTPSRSKPNYWNNGNIPWIKIKDMKSKYIDSAEEFITEEGLNNSSTKMLKRDTILYSIFATLGEVGILKIDACTNQAIAGLSLKEDSNILKEYLYYYLKSKKKDVNNLGRGVAQNNINLSLLRKFKIPVIPLRQQKKIVEVLDNVSSTINNYERELALLDELVKARFVEMFGDPIKNSKRYPIRQFSDYIISLTSGSRGWAKYCVDDGEEWFITIKNVKDCNVITDNMQPVNAPSNAEAKRTKVKEGDLLISITADLGRTGVVTREVAEHGAYINQHLSCIRINRDILNPLYVAHYMESPAGKRQFVQKNQSAVKAGLNFNSINSLKLLVPPMEEQNKFIRFVKQIDKSRSRIQKSLEASQELFDSLMQEYFG